MTRSITLVGAGLAGSLLALFLARRGFEVTVHEARPDLRKTRGPAGRSINLALANRGIEALRAVGLMDRVEPLLIPMRGRRLHARDGTAGFQPYGRTPTEVIHSVSRGQLNAVLMDAAEATGRVEFRFGSRCEGYDFDAGALLIRDSRGAPVEPVPCPRVIATDGAGSPLRRSLVEYHNAESREELLEHGYKELNMPARDGTHAMDADALHIWPRGGYMLIALPNTDGSFTVTLFLPHIGTPGFDALRDEAAVQDFFAAEFPDALDLIPGLPKRFLSNPTGHMGTVYLRPWHHEDRLLLLGDAAHAIVPFHGQGMNCAFEDCAELDACIADAGDDWAGAFAEFERRRKPNADAIAQMALENYVEMRDLVAQPRFQLQKKLEFALEERHPGRFIPRYAMVMFHSLPYAEAQRRGAVQKTILDELTEGVESLDGVDFAKADALVEDRCRW